MTYINNKRDANEAAILEIFKAAGGEWEQTQVGHDGYLHLKGMSFVIEVKNGNAPLTKDEVLFKNRIERTGVRYWIIRNEQMAAALINAEYSRIPDEIWIVENDKPRRIDKNSAIEWRMGA